MSDNQKTLEEINELVSVSLSFYMAANSTDTISKAYDSNVTEQERSDIMQLFGEIQIMQSGSYDPGPYVLLGKKAETDEELIELAEKQIAFTDKFAAVVSREIDQATLSSLLVTEADRSDVEQSYAALKADNLAKLCV